MFSFRYDAHLVPAMLANIGPMVDGWVSWDDRASRDIVSNDLALRLRLLQAAYQGGADWVLRVDPDERFEPALAERMDKLTARQRPIVWMFDLRELYTPDTYRIDGVWGRKRQGRLFPLFDWLFPVETSPHFDRKAFHSASYPRAFRPKKTGLDLYHLKMISPERRAHRSALYTALDPECLYQPTGYTYLADEEGARFRRIAPDRLYHPPHQEDGGLWMPARLPRIEAARSER
jgi:hypothetical protein